MRQINMLQILSAWKCRGRSQEGERERDTHTTRRHTAAVLALTWTHRTYIIWLQETRKLATSYLSLKKSPRATAYVMAGTMGKPLDRERDGCISPTYWTSLDMNGCITMWEHNVKGKALMSGLQIEFHIWSFCFEEGQIFLFVHFLWYFSTNFK